MSKAYSSNLTLEQRELIEPLIPPAKSGGRPREVEVWDILNAIFYLLTQGCTWRNLPGDFPAWQTVYRYFRTWRNDGTWLMLHDTSWAIGLLHNSHSCGLYYIVKICSNVVERRV